MLLGLAALATGCVRFEPRPLAPAMTAAAFEARTLDDPALRTFLESNLARPLPDWPPVRWDFETLTLAAFYFHPSLDVARAQWRVAQGGMKTAGGRPNPTLSAIPAYNFNAASGVSPWLPGLNCDWPIETMGKRGYRQARSGHLTEAARWNIFTTAWQVRSNLRTALAEFHFASQRADGLAQQVDAQKVLARLLEERLAAGAVSATEATVYHLALNKASFELAEARRQTALARSHVAEALGLTAPALASVPLPPLPAPDDAPRLDLSSATLRQAALCGRADILSALAEYDATQSALQLELARQYPDLHLGNGYQWDQGESKWSLALTAELPLLNQNRGPIAEAEARRAEAAARLLALQARVITGVDAARLNHALVLAQQTQARALVQIQEQRQHAITMAQQAGGADLLEVESARLEGLTGRLVLLEVEQRLQQAAAQLEDALQRPFTGLSGVVAEPRPAPAFKKSP